jgi:predicted nucleotide-binding protein
MARTAEASEKAAGAAKKRLSQSDVPSTSLENALRIPRALAEQYGKQPATPVEVAVALDMSPTSGPFRALTGAAIAYGLTEGGYNAEVIGLADLGRRIVAPTEEGDDTAAMREAFLRPRVIREFLAKYDGSPLPSSPIAKNVLEAMNVPSGRAASTFELIVEGASMLGFVATIKDKRYVNLRAAHLRVVDMPEEDDAVSESQDVPVESGLDEVFELPDGAVVELPPRLERNRRVFVSHGSNRQVVEHLKELLEYGEYDPVVAVERETTSKPVPDKVLDDMRSCAAGIIHVGVESVIIDTEGAEHPQLNSNVLIEIGAAMALYGRNFILLVEEGTRLPSNLQGLYEVRYEGKSMDAGATMKLLKAFKEFKG